MDNLESITTPEPPLDDGKPQAEVVDEALHLLLIEDNPGDAVLIRALLDETDVETLGQGVAKLEEARFSAVITDLNLPDSSGIGTLQRLVATGSDIPVIVLTHSDDDPVAIEMVKCGAQDYLIKGQSDGALILKTVRYAIERKLSDRHLRYLSHHDKLTGLANRELFKDRLAQAVARAERSGNLVALLFLDLDRSKSINDMLGHLAADKLLVAVAERLKTCVRNVDTIARLGGDEFTIVLEDVATPFDAELVCRKVVGALEDPLEIEGQEIYATASIGVTFFPTDATEVTGLIRNADVAMYRAKEDGRNKYHLFTADLNARAVERLSIETALRHALDREELFLCYQPKVNLQTGRVLGVEALVRWQHPHRGIVSPDEFVPVAEETGLIVPVGEWVLRQACEDALRWSRSGVEDVNVAVNLSARQFRQGDLLKTVDNIFCELSFDPNRLELEITESLLMDDTEASEVALYDLKAFGLSIYLDDFGTGYSSLAYLKKFPIDGLKIDRSFIRDIPGDVDDEAITRAIVALSQAQRLKVVAEGVETRAQLDFLNLEGCDEVQGYLFSKPLTYDRLVEWIRARNVDVLESALASG
ncbi:MAG: EAL domain-containing protein [Gammaproteobacteria bacterium]|jgi:diguanylate cyclase (GGDEF)-like protein|nr:EAL domain-containing protein [Gammaproteobacteria bacterium]